MEEESQEVRDEEEEQFEEEDRKAARKKKLTKLVALVLVIAIVGGIGGWYAVTSLLNAPPTAAFTASSQDLRLSVDASNSTDPNGDALTFRWDWGDASPTDAGKTASHIYAAEGTYTVTLTATDARGAAGSLPRSVTLTILPTALFVARTTQMTVSVDASSSFVLNGAITNYAWDFGDGSTGTGVQATHAYATPGRYTITLTVTDDDTRTMSTTRLVSPASTTVDVVFDQFYQLNCPYREYWNLRYDSYGDQILTDTIPCTSYYPWVLFSASTALQPINPSWVYTTYRQDSKVRNHPGYNLLDPVVLPVFNSSVTPGLGSYIIINMTMDYLDSDLLNALKNPPWYVSQKYSDGFGYLVQGNITMDLTMSKRIFGVKAANADEAQLWWWNYTGEGTGTSPRSPGPLEANVALWLEDNGNVKYDIYNGFEWFYETDLTYLNATVDPDGTTHVRIFWDGWGYDVLLARWFYWGKASYRDAVCVQSENCTETQPYGAIQPLGWAPMEICWCETASIDLRITSSLDLDMTAVAGYVFYAGADPGRDQILGTRDDEPRWVFEPANMDYVPRLGSGSVGQGGYGQSELRFYEDETRIVTTPGGYAYGEPYEYTFAPTRWRLTAGNTLQIILPRDVDGNPLEVPWYDPVNSRWDPVAKIGVYQSTMASMTLSRVTPAANPLDPYYVWDARGRVVSLAGPFSSGATGVPLYGEPIIEFRPG